MEIEDITMLINKRFKKGDLVQIISNNHEGFLLVEIIRVEKVKCKDAIYDETYNYKYKKIAIFKCNIDNMVKHKSGIRWSNLSNLDLSYEVVSGELANRLIDKCIVNNL